MKYILILTATSTHKDGGITIHSIEFNDEDCAYDAGRKWYDRILVKNLNADFIVVRNP